MPKQPVHKLTIVSGADSKYFRCLYQFLQSIFAANIYYENRIIIYDLGLTAAQINILTNKKVVKFDFELRAFPFNDYPEYFKIQPNYPINEKRDIKVESHGCYAWKAVIVSKVFTEIKANILWLDSATIILKPLGPIARTIEEFGVYVPIGGSGITKEWIHPETITYMQADATLLNQPCLAACVCGFSYASPIAREIVRRWEQFSLVKECIAPNPPFERSRYDQSILNILLYQFESQGKISLTKEQVNISSENTQPISLLIVRNKVKSKTPLYLDLFIRYYFAIKFKAGSMINRFRFSLISET